MRQKFVFFAVIAVSFLMALLLPRLPAPQVEPRQALSSAGQDGMAAISAVSAVNQLQAAASKANPALAEPTATSVRGSEPNPVRGSELKLPDLASFSASVANQQPGSVVGIYAPGIFALPVVQQPDGNNDFVSSLDSTLTQYAAPEQYGAVVILAHNTLSGQLFFQMKTGQEVVLVFGDGQMERYQVSAIDTYQALSPDDPFSDFVDLKDPGAKVQSFQAVFDRFYTTAGALVFQTCIEANGNPSWGRIFIRAGRLQ